MKLNIATLVLLTVTSAASAAPKEAPPRLIPEEGVYYRQPDQKESSQVQLGVKKNILERAKEKKERQQMIDSKPHPLPPPLSSSTPRKALEPQI